MRTHGGSHFQAGLPSGVRTTRPSSIAFPSASPRNNQPTRSDSFASPQVKTAVLDTGHINSAPALRPGEDLPYRRTPNQNAISTDLETLSNEVTWVVFLFLLYRYLSRTQKQTYLLTSTTQTDIRQCNLHCLCNGAYAALGTRSIFQMFLLVRKLDTCKE